MSTNPADFMYDRTFGQDAAATADYVAQVVSQMAEDGMGSVLKHFPGYGNNVDTHTGIAVDQRPLESFTSSDFLPFQAGMESGGGKTAVLVSHNIMTAVDGDLPASLSPKVHGLLRTDLGFDGVVMTDDLAMGGSCSVQRRRGRGGDGPGGRETISSSPTDYRTQIPKVLEALESGACPGRPSTPPAAGADLEAESGAAVTYLPVPSPDERKFSTWKRKNSITKIPTSPPSPPGCSPVKNPNPTGP